MDWTPQLRRHKAHDPDKIAVVGSRRRLTYATLDDTADAVANGLRDAGLPPGGRVAVQLPNDVEFIEAYVGIIRAGGVVVPLNLRLAQDEIDHQLRDSQASLLITAPDTTPSLGTPSHDANGEGWWESLAQRHLTARDQCPPEIERIMYTSGTTSRPRGVLITREQVWWGGLTRCSDFGLTNEDVTLTVAPLYHVGGLDSFTTPILITGGTVVLAPRFDPANVLALIRDEAITCTWLAPTLLRQLFTHVDHSQADPGPGPRVVLGGGEKAPEPVLRRLAATWPDAGYYDAYGLTECQGIATYLHARLSKERRGSVGLPATGRQVGVIDDDGTLRRTEGQGEVVLGGPLVSPGYWHDTDATTAAFTGDGWLRTGDIGRMDEGGFLTLIDRKKDMIRSGLENVASSEIERVLYAHPDVIEAAVVARQDDRWGEVPVAFVHTKADMDLQGLRDHCSSALAKFKVPTAFIEVTDFPRTSSGKIRKAELRSNLAEDST